MADAALSGGNASISGTVTDDDSGDPVSGVTVRLYREGGSSVVSTTTAANGTYSFPVVGSGNYDLEFSADGYDTEWYDDAASAAAGSVTVDNDEDVVADAALTAEEPEPDPGSISGMITDDSDPVSGVTVEAYVGGAVIGSTTSAADGTYTISELVDDTYTVLANNRSGGEPGLVLLGLVHRCSTVPDRRRHRCRRRRRRRHGWRRHYAPAVVRRRRGGKAGSMPTSCGCRRAGSPWAAEMTPIAPAIRSPGRRWPPSWSGRWSWRPTPPTTSPTTTATSTRRTSMRWPEPV